MTDLSASMRHGLALAKEKGALVRIDGGYWCPPNEPLVHGRPRTGRHVGTQTVNALRKRGLLTGVGRGRAKVR